MQSEKQPSRQCAVLVKSVVPPGCIAGEAIPIIEYVMGNLGCVVETAGVFVAVFVVGKEPS